MAHQLVAEQATSLLSKNKYQASPCESLRAASDKPHGELFKEACRRLGVPAQFARAEIDLQNCNLDWHFESGDTVAEKMIDKAKKLLALAGSSNEHEAQSAAARVRELYAKYNLEQNEKLSRESFVHQVITHGKTRMTAWEHRTVSLLMEHYFVQVLLLQQFDIRSGQSVQAIELIGTRENVLMAEYVYYFLLNQVEYLLKRELKSGSKLVGREKKSFRLGVLEGFAKKLATQCETQTRHDLAQSTSPNMVNLALSQFKNDPRLNDYLSEIYPRLGHRRTGSWLIDNDAYGAGHSAGQSIHLQKPIENRAGNLGRLLNSRQLWVNRANVVPQLCPWVSTAAHMLDELV